MPSSRWITPRSAPPSSPPKREKKDEPLQLDADRGVRYGRAEQRPQRDQRQHRQFLNRRLQGRAGAVRDRSRSERHLRVRVGRRADRHPLRCVDARHAGDDDLVDRSRRQRQRLLRREPGRPGHLPDARRLLRPRFKRQSREHRRIPADGTGHQRRWHDEFDAVRRQHRRPDAAEGGLHHGHTDGEPAVHRNGDRLRQLAIDQLGKCDLHGQDLDHRLRQSRQRGRARRLSDEDRRQRLGGGRLPAGARPRRRVASPTQAVLSTHST